jgi:hypothetical protein
LVNPTAVVEAPRTTRAHAAPRAARLRYQREEVDPVAEVEVGDGLGLRGAFVMMWAEYGGLLRGQCVGRSSEVG